MYGIDSIIRSEQSNNLVIKGRVEDYSDKVYTDTAEPISSNNFDDLYIIHDTKFINIRMSSGSNLIDLKNHLTFYITSCLFQSCATSKQILSLETRACTISHICCSDLQQIGENEGEKDKEGLFIYSNTPQGSFIKFIYSTLFGDYEEIKAKYVVNFRGSCSMKYQCNNITKFKLQYKRDNENVDRYSILRLVSPDCLIMMMNSFDKLYSCRIMEYNHQAENTQYAHYISKKIFWMLNFKMLALLLIKTMIEN